MEMHQISFAKVCVLSNDLAEITVDCGADINLNMVNELHQLLLSLFCDSFSLLINKSNSYSTQLDALIHFGTLPAIDKIAIFAPNKLAKMSADFSATIPSSAVLTIEVFTERDDALEWLIEEKNSPICE
ncbi:STAS/SEC14 domain-containing protein [Colwellia psychrerythraea]|uniref:STAS/SEC14 domain-containing protein n=1 Tax=Colwellia psychrerythraea TaxID=28229 RepID=A0A1Y5E2Y1_COLPS|nr:STAS/SEC14 domain-containing protein [Colwellia psychrerythraea]